MDHKTKMLEQIDEGIFDSLPDEQLQGFTDALIDIGLLSFKDQEEILRKYEERKHQVTHVANGKSIASPSAGGYSQ
jgi:hypothetical protein